MLKIRNIVLFIAVFTLATACASTRELSPLISASYSAATAKLTFSSPNFSAPHLPPLITSYAYVDTYAFNEFCGGAGAKPISKSSVNKAARIQVSKLPTGKVVANIGYKATGGGGLVGNSYFVMTLKPNGQYRITLTEARPFVTSYSVTLESIENGKTKKLEAKNFKWKKDVCG